MDGFSAVRVVRNSALVSNAVRARGN